MSADEPDVEELVVVIDRRDQSAVVALDIEHHPVAIDDARRRIALFQLVGRTPLGLPGLMEPRLERLFGIGVFRPKLHKRFACNDSQNVAG